MANGHVVKSSNNLFMFGENGVGLTWFKPYVANGKTFTKKNVADILVLIYGQGDREWWIDRAETLCKQAVYYGQIGQFGNERRRFYFLEKTNG